MEKKIVELFEIEKERTKKFTKKVCIGNEKILYDFSKTHMSEDILDHYVDKISKYSNKIDGMFSGEKINFTEDRKVLHVALRSKNVLDNIENNASNSLNSEEKDIFNELTKIKRFADEFDKGKMLGVTGKPLDTIVNIGIGGSDLGPRMVCDALSYYKRPGKKVHFISNIDATETFQVFDKIDVEKTLFIVVSKTFTTLETIKNAELSLKLISQKLNAKTTEIAKKQFVAVSSNLEEIKKYGIENVFAMWDYVGGRFSLWSAVGLSIVLYLGFDNFVKLLRGASKSDESFKSLKGKDNAEIVHAAVEIFYSENGYNNKCIVPYDQYLEKLYLYLQQAEMESNGKPSDKTDTGMIIWGGIGTNTQHSFFQLLHQGTRKVLTEFLVPSKPLHSEIPYHNMVVSNCLAQSRGLMTGKKGNNKNDHFEGDRPSIFVLYSKLTPETLGALIAHYEHKIFLMGLYWNINSFDQFGVTLGKTIATELLGAISEHKEDGYDNSTNQLLKLVKESEN